VDVVVQCGHVVLSPWQFCSLAWYYSQIQSSKRLLNFDRLVLKPFRIFFKYFSTFYAFKTDQSLLHNKTSWLNMFHARLMDISLE